METHTHGSSPILETIEVPTPPSGGFTWWYCGGEVWTWLGVRLRPFLHCLCNLPMTVYRVPERVELQETWWILQCLWNEWPIGKYLVCLWRVHPTPFLYFLLLGTLSEEYLLVFYSTPQFVRPSDSIYACRIKLL